MQIINTTAAAVVFSPFLLFIFFLLSCLLRCCFWSSHRALGYYSMLWFSKIADLFSRGKPNSLYGKLCTAKMLKCTLNIKIRNNICIFYITYNVSNLINCKIVFRTALYVFLKKTKQANWKTRISSLYDFHLHRSISYPVRNTFVVCRLESQLAIHLHGIRGRINRKHAAPPAADNRWAFFQTVVCLCPVCDIQTSGFLL